MTKTVGHRQRDDFELDPAEAWKRGRSIDRLLAGTTPPHPRGIFRGPHARFNAMDDARALQAARRLNGR